MRATTIIAIIVGLLATICLLALFAEIGGIMGHTLFIITFIVAGFFGIRQLVRTYGPWFTTNRTNLLIIGGGILFIAFCFFLLSLIGDNGSSPSSPSPSVTRIASNTSTPVKIHSGTRRGELTERGLSYPIDGQEFDWGRVGENAYRNEVTMIIERTDGSTETVTLPAGRKTDDYALGFGIKRIIAKCKNPGQLFEVRYR